jgi:prepilin-type N-terminal cleavage/methylation domain-containing protein
LKKAFTLIELLVVIAIIAILAAILFPVFAQAKTAAKKTAAISNQKQIGLAVLQYMADYDDTYPRNDGCELNSSLNPAQNDGRAGQDPSAKCQDNPPNVAWRMNHFSWQKWVLPYTKNVQLFEHPGRDRLADQWERQGQIFGGFALNTALTGQLNTFGDPNRARAFRDSWLGGTQTAVPNVAQAMLLMEFSNATINFSPVALVTGQNTNTVTAYPAAFRGVWSRMFFRRSANCGGNFPPTELTNTVDNRAVFAEGIVVGYADGSAKFVGVKRFLALTPPEGAEYATPTDNQCGFSSGIVSIARAPVLTGNYPLWALGTQ